MDGNGSDNGEITPVILCGGGGTRLWPRSRAACPKPFLPLTGERTLFQAALDRCPRDLGFARPIIVAGAAHSDLVETQLGGLDAELIVEPAAKNTGAAIALAALRLPPDAVMLVCPSDHHIGDPAAFAAAARNAARLAREGWLVAFGIAASRPETGYGYLKRGETIGGGAFSVERFVEKPDAATAERFLTEGGYAWNGGIFAFRAGDFLHELTMQRFAMVEAVRDAVRGGREDGRRFFADGPAFDRVIAESVDYAVMEHASRVAMVPVDMGWSDIGTWPALHAARTCDAAGNSVSGSAELVDCRDVLVDTDGPRVSVVGLSGVAIVVDGDEILVTSARDAQQVGKLAGAKGQ